MKRLIVLLLSLGLAPLVSAAPVMLSWTYPANPSPAPTGFEVRWRVPQGTQAIAGLVPGTQMSFSENERSAPVCYQVFAYIAGTPNVYSVGSNESCQPPGVTNLLASIGAQSITLTWQYIPDPALPDQGALVQRRVAGGSVWDPPIQLSAGVRTMTDNGIVPGQQYEYRVITLAGVDAQNPQGTAWSSPVSISAGLLLVGPNGLTIRFQ